jgi:hypothetical protein
MLGGEIIDMKLFKRLFKEHVKGVAKITGPVFKGSELQVKDLEGHSLNNLKVQGFSPVNNGEKINTMTIEAEKSSYAILWPSEAIRSGTAENLLHIMDKKIDVLGPPSTKKGDLLRDASKFKVASTMSERIADSLIYQVPYFSYGIQVSTETKSKIVVNKSTQLDRMLFYDLVTKMDNKLTDHKKDLLKSLHDEYYEINKSLIDSRTNQLMYDLGLEYSAEENTWKMRSPKALIEKMEALMQKGDISENLLKQVKAVFESDNPYFDTLPVKSDLLSKIIGMFREEVFAFPVKGEMFVQESSTIWGHDASLQFYRIENGKTLPMQVRLTLNWKDYKQLMKVYGSLESLNEALASDDPSLDVLRYVTGNRVPSDNTHSFDNIEIVEFLPPWTGQRIVLPPEVVIKSGTDFDIDKLTTYLNNFRILKVYREKGKPRLIIKKEEYYRDFNDAAEEQLVRSEKSLKRIMYTLKNQNKISEDDYQQFLNYVDLIESVKESIDKEMENTFHPSNEQIKEIIEDDTISDEEFEILITRLR